MKKAKKVRINGEDWKFFVDKGALDGDNRPFCRVILYAKDGSVHYWNLNGSEGTVFSAPSIKDAWRNGKFCIHFERRRG